MVTDGSVNGERSSIFLLTSRIVVCFAIDLKVNVISIIKLMKGKALREHSMHEKTAASVLLKLFISSNE